MNNLKRILSLALASVMVIGMMVVGASAAEFVDDDQITHDAAVDTMTALNIIGGYAEDNTFRPNVKVTRAQMAKMIAVALNGGKDPVAGLTTGSKFVDVATNHWAIDYITYCANLGIISGKDATHFDPEGFVKANEAAKMLLVAIGYDSETFGFTGANWSTNVLRMATTLLIGGTLKTDANGVTSLVGASSLNLFDGLEGVAADAELTRDQAAQLIYNGIQANSVQMSLTGVVDNKPSYTYSLTGKSLLESKFGAKVEEGIMTSAVYTAATKTVPASWKYVIGGKTYTSALDISDLFMQKVRVVHQTPKSGKTTVLALTAAAHDVVVDCLWDDLAPSQDGTTLNGYALGAADAQTPVTAATLPVYSFLNTAAGNLNANYNEYDKTQLIDNNGDGRLDCVVVTPVVVNQVSNVRPTYIQIRGLSTNVMLETNNVPEGLAVNDFVTYTQNPQTKVVTVEKAEIVTGRMTATMDAIANRRPDQVQLDNGSWYTVVSNYATLKALVGDEVDLVSVAGYVVNGKRISDATVTSNAVMAVATATDVTTNTTSVDAAAKYLEIKVLKDDNTTENLKVSKVVKNGTPTAVSQKSDVTVGTLYTYTADPAASGCVVLTAYAPKVGTASDAKYTDSFTGNAFTIASGIVTNAGKTQSFRIDDDATLFVMAGTKYAVLKGADVNKWNKAGNTPYTATTVAAVYASQASNGFIYVQEGAIILNGETEIPGAAGAAKYYGYVTANAYFTKSADGKTSYIAVPLWNGSETVTVLAKTVVANAEDTTTPGVGATQADETRFTAGKLVRYTDNGDGTASDLILLNQDNDAIVAWDNRSAVKFEKESPNKEITIDDKTVILFIDGSNGAGVASGNVVTADWVDPYTPTDGRYANVYYVKTSTVANTNDHVDVLILDTTNRIGRTPAVVGEIAVKVGSLENNSNDLTNKKPAAGNKATLAADADKAITGKAIDTITFNNGANTLYTLGDVGADLGLTGSTVYYLYTMNFEYSGEQDANNTYTITKTLNKGTKGPASATATNAQDPATLTILCGNAQDGKWEIKQGNTLLYTLTWDSAALTMTVEAPAAQQPAPTPGA